MKRRWTIPEEDLAASLYRSDWTIAAIAKRLQRTRWSVSQKIGRICERNRVRPVSDVAKKVEKHLRQGHSAAETARLVGTSERTVGRIRRQLGMPVFDYSPERRAALTARGIHRSMLSSGTSSTAERYAWEREESVRAGWPECTASEREVLAMLEGGPLPVEALAGNRGVRYMDGRLNTMRRRGWVEKLHQYGLPVWRLSEHVLELRERCRIEARHEAAA